MKRIVLAILWVAGSSAYAQEQPPRTKIVHRIIELKHADAGRVRGILEIFGGLGVRVDPALRTIAISGNEEVVASAEEAIRKLDVPPTPPPAIMRRNIETTIHLLMATQQQGQSGKLPADLEGVVKQLRTVSNYQSFRAGESIVIRTRDGSGIETYGVMPVFTKQEGLPDGTYHVRVGEVVAEGADKNVTLRYNNFRFTGRMPFGQPPGGIQFRDVTLSTHLDVREGQKVVVGKTLVDGAESSLILVLTARVLD